MHVHALPHLQRIGVPSQLALTAMAIDPVDSRFEFGVMSLAVHFVLQYNP